MSEQPVAGGAPQGAAPGPAAVQGQPMTTGKPKRRHTRRKRNPDGTMPLIEHIYELRRRVVIAAIAIVLTTIVGFAWYSISVGPIRALGDILTGPYCDLPASARADFGHDEQCRLLATGPFEQFMLRLKVALTAGVVLACPVWLYQLWAFIMPGLHKKERRYGLVFTILAAILFITGAVLAYVVVTHALQFLLQVGDNVQVTALSGSEYFTFIMQLILIFGVSFEIPLLVAMLNIVGVVSYETLAKARRGIIVAIFVFAAVASPGSDPFSMLALACAVCLLVEFAIQFARINDKRRKTVRPDWLDVDDEHSSPITASGGVGQTGGIDAPAPLEASRPLGNGGNLLPTTPVGPSAPTSNSGPLPPNTPPPARGYDDVL